MAVGFLKWEEHLAEVGLEGSSKDRTKNMRYGSWNLYSGASIQMPDMSNRVLSRRKHGGKRRQQGISEGALAILYAGMCFGSTGNPKYEAIGEQGAGSRETNQQ